MAADPYRDSIHIDAAPAVVFRYFTEPEALASWMGDRAVVDPYPGGRFVVWFDDRAVEGRYLEVEAPNRVVVTWGRVGSSEMPPGSSTLEVTLVAEGTGTRVSIVHWGLPESEAPRHALGWAHYLCRLAGVAAGRNVEPHRTPAELTDGVD